MNWHQKLKNKGENPICSICLAEIRKGKERRLPCQHILHKKCFERLRSTGHWKCPYCREPFKKRSKKCSHEAKIDNFHILEDAHYVTSTIERMDRRPYWDNLSLLPPLTPSGSVNSRQELGPAHRSGSPHSHSEKERNSSSLSGGAKRESQVSRRRFQPQPIEPREKGGRECYQADNQERRNRPSHLEDDAEDSVDELFNQVLENLTEEPFFRFFSSNIVHEHEEREGMRWSHSRRNSPVPNGRRDIAE